MRCPRVTHLTKLRSKNLRWRLESFSRFHQSRLRGSLKRRLKSNHEVSWHVHPSPCARDDRYRPKSSREKLEYSSFLFAHVPSMMTETLLPHWALAQSSYG